MMRTRNTEIDQIVATYAAIGRVQRRRAWTYSLVALATTPLLALLTWQIMDREPAPAGPQISQTEALIQPAPEPTRQPPSPPANPPAPAPLAAAEPGVAESGDFDKNRDELLEQSVLLESELDLLSERRRQLELENEDISLKREKISRAFDEIEAQNREIEAQKARIAAVNPKLREERAELEAERIELENLRTKFAEESSLLEEEILAINRERTELAAQRIIVQQRREELQRLIEQSRSLETTPPRESTPENSAQQQEELAPDQASNKGPRPGFELQSGPITAHAQPADYRRSSLVNSPLGPDFVDPGELDQMRGGFDVGEYQVSIGLTRSASVNGTEQYTSYLNLTDAMNGVSAADMEDASVSLVQNGEGNYVSPDVLGSLSGNFSTIVQNSLDNQEIQLKNVYDISVQNVSEVVLDVSARKAIDDAINLIN